MACGETSRGLVWGKETLRDGQRGRRREMERKGGNTGRGASQSGVKETGLAQADVAFGRSEHETKGLFGLPGLGKGQ